MTEEQMREFWEKQQIIQPSDIIIENGVPLIKASKMNEIVNQYHFTGYIKGRFYPLYEVGSKVMEVEYNLSKQQRRDSSAAPVNIVYRFFAEKVSKLEEQKKSDPVFLAWEIDKLFHNAKQTVILDGLIQAQKEGIIEDYHSIENAYRECQEIRSKVDLKTVPEQHYIDTLLELHENGTSFPHLVQLISHADISSEMKWRLREEIYEKERREEYEKLRPELKELADHSKLHGMAFIRALQKKYEDYNMKYVVDVLASVASKERLLEIKICYPELCPEDAYDQVENIMFQAKKNNSSASETVENLMDLGYDFKFILKTVERIQKKGLVLDYAEMNQAFAKYYRESTWLVVNAHMLARQYKSGVSAETLIERNKANGYPDYILFETLNYMKQNGMDFPYEDFYQILVQGKASKKEETVIDDSFQVPVGVVMPAMNANSDRLSETPTTVLEESPGESLENSPEENMEEPEQENLAEQRERNHTPRRRRVVRTRQAKSALERKALVSLAVASAGAISSAVLINLFGVNPLVAARNCYASITAGNAALTQLLPAGKELISIFASIGTTIAGTIMYLRNDAKLRHEEYRGGMGR